MYYIIINPASRSGKGAKLWADIEPVIKDKGIPYKAFFSKEAGHVSKIIRDISDSVLTGDSAEILKLIVLGGDGTINEALQGITDFDRTWVGYIPTGSSNDLARDLKFGSDTVAVLERILSCSQPFLMDVGCLTYKDPDGTEQKRYYVGSCGIGYDAAVCEETLTSKFKMIFNKIGLGKLTYLAIALKQLLTAKKVSCTFTLDNKKTVTMPKFFFVAFMQHQYEGGGFMFCPGADYQDGILDICAVGNIPKWKVLIALPTAFKGKHYFFNGIDAYRTSEIHLEASAPLWVHTDGEVVTKTDSVTASCLKQKLQFLF